jgi:hypothetical protein
LVCRNKLVNQSNQDSAPTNAPPHYNQTIQKTTEAYNFQDDTETSQDKSDTDDVQEIFDKATKRNKGLSILSMEVKAACKKRRINHSFGSRKRIPSSKRALLSKVQLSNSYRSNYKRHMKKQTF